MTIGSVGPVIDSHRFGYCSCLDRDCIRECAVPLQGNSQGRSDPVVSLAPHHDRLYTSAQLVEADHADTLMVSHLDGDVAVKNSGEAFQQVSVTGYCDAHKTSGITCFTSAEVATIGEAFTVRDLAAQES